jgi:NADH-quinone oxidoreductase subunit F
MPEMRLLLRDIDIPDIEYIETYRAHGGYAALARVQREMSPLDVVDLVDKAGLRDRGGTWKALAPRWRELAGRTEYLCVNANESSPGAFRDRKLIERHPHQFIEGVAIAAYALEVRQVYICMRPEMKRGIQLLKSALQEVRASGILDMATTDIEATLEIVVHVGGGAYIAGEETALLASLEGQRAEPKAQPPPAWQWGLWGRPAIVENAGTLCYLPHIVERGADWFASLGADTCSGTLVFCISGHVCRPGLYELELGTATLRQLIEEHAGGVRVGHRLKAVLPGGGAPPLLDEHLDVHLVPGDWAVPGGGSCPSAFINGAIVVMDETVCMVDAALNLMEFYARESCGQCPPCRGGSAWLRDILTRLEAGRGRVADLDLLLEVAEQVSPWLSNERAGICAFSQEFSWLLQGFLRYFSEEFALHAEVGACPVDKDFSIKTPETISVRF